ncbi:hypothetical protein PM082_013644 [Marasmius tenuissimus]|nr:hypothetical protein PM082_013644 [Marasmius tenuissimus]
MCSVQYLTLARCSDSIPKAIFHKEIHRCLKDTLDGRMSPTRSKIQLACTRCQ